MLTSTSDTSAGFPLRSMRFHSFGQEFPQFDANTKMRIFFFSLTHSAHRSFFFLRPAMGDVCCKKKKFHSNRISVKKKMFQKIRRLAAISWKAVRPCCLISSEFSVDKWHSLTAVCTWQSRMVKFWGSVKYADFHAEMETARPKEGAIITRRETSLKETALVRMVSVHCLTDSLSTISTGA